MPQSVRYSLVIHRVAQDNGIRNTMDPVAEFCIPNDIFGDTQIALNDGDVDVPIQLIGEVLDFVAIYTDQPITVKFNSTTGTPLYLRGRGALMIDSQNITGIFISNASGQVAHPRVLQAIRQPGFAQ